jgi:hypothetical protein
MTQQNPSSRHPDERPGPLVEVEWIDITGQQGWLPLDEVRRQRGLGRCFSVGHLVDDDKAGVVLVTSWGDFGLVADWMEIPRRSVVAVRRLEGGADV